MSCINYELSKSQAAPDAHHIVGKTLLQRAEQLWDDLQKDELGGFSGINRPFWIVQAFRRLLKDHDEFASQAAPGGDAREVARRIADSSIDGRICCGKYPPCQTEAWRAALTGEIAALITRREQAASDRMRERIAAELHSRANHHRGMVRDLDGDAAYHDPAVDALSSAVRWIDTLKDEPPLPDNPDQPVIETQE